MNLEVCFETSGLSEKREDNYHNNHLTNCNIINIYIYKYKFNNS